MTEAAAPVAEDTQTIYTAYEIDFMLGLRSTESSRITREQISLRSAPEAAAEYVSAAVAAGLRARGKVEQAPDGQWLLGREGQIIAGTLTSADRWLGVALAQDGAMRMAFIVAAEESVLLLTQDELDTFQITALASREHVPDAVADISRAFLSQGAGTSVSMRRCDLADPATTVPLMLHAEADGRWQAGHEPVTDEDVLTVSEIQPAQVLGLVTRLWEDGVSAAPAS
ncbi:hypothetical protein [Brachybacterium hainanense]|uniref:Uncharacterized protein n=1 Tax=Brachybacterium hainanense TaxID=1541174 RepID=A0ABV6RDQ2_9MICO